ncbi:hypothetical protein M9H77_06020 [Catharanthus roseus]|uniref:Uncharacterized protein n=1 Tax=Catharanthus roseus TaxID=4058 RepID=A0ACC0BQX5_CATRO|nr:hypothetical protein M9H77_06020 [Catharanthus roseus]
MYRKHQGWRISNKDPCTISAFRASSDDVDGFFTLRVDPLEEGPSTWRMWLNRLTQDGKRYNKPLKGTQISYFAAVDLVVELRVSQILLFLRSGGLVSN